jgi:hypothetical protein
MTKSMFSYIRAHAHLLDAKRIHDLGIYILWLEPARVLITPDVQR